jgi:hypothetical protein
MIFDHIESRRKLVGRRPMAVRHDTDSINGRDKCPRLKPRHAALKGEAAKASHIVT